MKTLTEVVGNYNITNPIIPVNRQFKNNVDLDVIIYTINNKLTIADRLVLVALYALSEKYGEFRVRIDMLARMSGVGHVTVTRALKKLLQLNYVRRWNLGGTPRYVVCDEILSVNYIKAGADISFYSDNDPEINKNIYIYTQGESRFRDLSWDERVSWGSKREYEKSCAMMAIALPMAMPRLLEKKQERKVKASVLIPDYVENITEVDLSFEDKLELAVFSGEVIGYARKAILKSGTLANPVGYFKGICRKQHQQRLSLPPISKKQTTQPSVKKQPPTQHDYDVAKYKYLEYMHKMTTKQPFKQNLYEQMQRQALKIDLEPEIQEITIKTESVLPEVQKNSNIAPDIEIEEYDYEPINTHNLFGS